jgi:type IV pilus assembly protein PilB
MSENSDAKLKEILIRGSYITEDDLTKAEKKATEQRSELEDVLLESGLLTKDLLGQAMAESWGVPYVDLNSNMPPRDQVLEIPENVAREYRVVLFSKKDDGYTVASDYPAQEGLSEKIYALFPGKTIRIGYSLGADIDANFVHYQKPLETRFVDIIKKQRRIAPEILDAIFGDALSFHASDVHFEPISKEVVVRFRVDGVLHEAGRLPKEYYENILNRIKVQSRLRIDEHNAAQDGSMRYENNDLAFDLRTSIVPTVEGEKVVLRVLASYVQGLTLSDIGLSSEHEKILIRAADKPFGMILVTGPTGSGKTTTLYALLKILNNVDVNITTIEDPVEYKVQGINQIQVNPQTNLTFAKGLRSIVRQDPDVILVGEIRDAETAEIAVNAALTGHLLLSTFHANDAATAVPRLIDMDIQPFLLASTLEVIVAQRLARKICETCRYGVETTEKDLKDKYKNVSSYFFAKGSEKTITLYAGKGCDACGNTGYKGRTAIFEFIENSPELQELILKNPSSRQIIEMSRKRGAKSMFEDGVEKVKGGITTLEELLRVSLPD